MGESGGGLDVEPKSVFQLVWLECSEGVVETRRRNLQLQLNVSLPARILCPSEQNHFLTHTNPLEVKTSKHTHTRTLFQAFYLCSTPTSGPQVFPCSCERFTHRQQAGD